MKTSNNSFKLLTAVLVDMSRRLRAKGVLLNVIPHARRVKSRGNHVLRDYRLRRIRTVLFGPNWGAVLRRHISESGIGRREDGEGFRP